MVFRSKVGVLLAVLMIPILHLRMQAEEARFSMLSSEVNMMLAISAQPDCCQEYIEVISLIGTKDGTGEIPKM